jgi:hypothetical protein
MQQNEYLKIITYLDGMYTKQGLILQTLLRIEELLKEIKTKEPKPWM